MDNKAFKIYGIIRTILLLALAIISVVFIELFVEHLKFFIGALIIFYGVEELLYTAFESKRHFSVDTLVWNIVETVIGFVMVVFLENESHEIMYATVCVVWATWAILREAKELVEAIKTFKRRITAIPDILESIAAIAFSILLILEPGPHHAAIHICLLVMELSTKALFPLIDQLYARAKAKRAAKAAKAAEASISADADATQEVAATTTDDPDQL